VVMLSLQAMLGWGDTLRTWYGRHAVNVDRQQDVSSDVSNDVSNDYIGYYTDNGQ